MIKFKKIRNIAFIGLILISTLSCEQEDFLETTNKSNLSDASMWASESNADIFLTDCYSQLYARSNQAQNLDSFTDDNDPNFYYTAFNWKKGICVSSSNSFSIWREISGPANDANWPATYSKVRKVNTYIMQLNNNSANFSAEYLAKRIDEAKFLRAYFYSELFMRIGGLSIITEPQDRATMTEDEIYVPRSTFEETFNFIIKELDDVINAGNLEVKYNNGNANAGRATLGAALALKGWLQLFAASPAYNSASPAVPASADNLQSFATPNAARWATAAATNKQFIDTYGHKGTGQYNLYPKMSEFWYEANEYNSEVIWDRQHVGNVMPNFYDRFGGGPKWGPDIDNWCNYTPTQELVDTYQMANGKDITDPTSGYDDQNPYVGREKRFYDFIVYDGASYKQDWMPEPFIVYTRIDRVNPALNEIDLAATDQSNTGYYSKKRLDNLHKPMGNMSGINYVYYRYGEVLLNYAEAQNEAVGPDASVYEAINAIRTRPGTDLPELTPGLTQAQMRDAIKRERRVELMYEDKRLYDLWRWKDAMVNLNTDLTCMVIRNSVPEDNSGVWGYTRTSLNHSHVFTQKMYFNPINQSVIDQNPKMIQNWGY
ncbi:MAG TPA: RagB/SusD family nutrient uptake outer membrane protein [Bacteroidales bacterium]|nr:RagB/SusD family nutrient uptake outer membrane protein [Bacteroidales bacterium]